MSILKSLIEGAIETYGEEGHLKITLFLSNYGVSDGELINFKRAWTAVYLGNKAFGSSKAPIKADKFSLEVIAELQSIDDDTDVLERYIDSYLAVADGCGKRGAGGREGADNKAAQVSGKNGAHIRQVFDFHGDVLALSSRALATGSLRSALDPATSYLLPTKSTMIHKHMFRNAKVKWSQSHGHGHTQVHGRERGTTRGSPAASGGGELQSAAGADAGPGGYSALCASAHGGVLSTVQGEVEFGRDAGSHHAAAAVEAELGREQGFDSGEKFLSSGSVVGYRLAARQHVFHAHYWETFHFLTEMLLLPSQPGARNSGADVAADAARGVGGSGAVEPDSYIGSKFQLLPYPVCMLKDAGGNLIMALEDPRGGAGVGSGTGASSSSSALQPLRSLFSPAFTAHLRNHPSVALHWCAQFQVLLTRLQHANYKCGLLQIGTRTGGEGMCVNDNQYAFTSEVLNHLYVRPNGNLVLGDVAYVYQAQRTGGDSGLGLGSEGVDSNPSIRTVRSLLRDFLTNALSLSRHFRVPVGERLDVARAARAGQMERPEDSDGEGGEDAEGGDFDFEDERAGDVSVITLLQGCQTSLQFLNRQLCNEPLNDIILLEPQDIFAFRGGGRALAAEARAGRTVVVQQQLHVHSRSAESVTGGEGDLQAEENRAVAHVFLSGEAGGAQALNVTARTSGVVTIYVGLSTTPYNVLRQQVQSGKVIQWSKCMAIRVIVLPKMHVYSPTTNVRAVPTAVTMNTAFAGSNCDFLELIELIALLENEYHSGPGSSSDSTFAHAQAFQNYFQHIQGYDEVRFNKLWKQIVDSIHKKRR